MKKTNHKSIINSKKHNWLLRHTLTVFSCVLIIALGITVLTYANPVTTTIGENISTNDLSVAGNVTNGTWQGSVVGTGYGGTGADLSAATQGGVPYFSETGVMSALDYGTDGYFLKAQGENNNPVWAEAASNVDTNAYTFIVYGEPRVNPTTFYVKDGRTGEVIFIETDNQHAERAIQAALDNLPIMTNYWGQTVQTGSVYLDIFGTWNMSAPIINPAVASGADRCNLHLWSIHPWSSMLKLVDGSNCSMVDWDGEFMGTIKNLAFHGNKAGQTEAHPVMDMEWLQDGEFYLVWVEASKGDGIHVGKGWSYAFRNCWIEHCDGIGLDLDNTINMVLSNMVVDHCTMIDNLQHIYMKGLIRSTIKDNIFVAAQQNDIEMYDTVNHGRIVHNTFLSGSTETPGSFDAIKIASGGFPKAIVVTSNTFEQGDPTYPSTYHAAVGLYSQVDYITVADNIMSSGLLPIYIDSDTYQLGFKNCRIYDMKMDSFESCAAASVNSIVAADDLGVDAPHEFVLAGQVDVPRKLSWELTHADISAFVIMIYGIDVNGHTVYDYITEADGWSGTTDFAYEWVTRARILSKTGSGTGDTCNIGLSDILGLRGIVYNEDDIPFLERKTGAARVNEAAQVTVGGRFVDLSGVNSGDGIGTGDTFHIHYRSAINTFY